MKAKSKFKKGQSGNPKGRPPGIQDKRVALRALLEPHAPRLIETAVTMALKGDAAALRICIDRLVPPLKARDSAIQIGPLSGSLVDQGKTVLGALTEGRITPDEAVSLMQAVGSQARIVEVDDLERRVKALEEHRHERAER